ncbi:MULTISPECIES: hypothetical protein [Pantoea]|uniref:Uncharacterized protein n=1 Tax=Pantoea rodasii TaxID=1076549 RepID=A0A0B1RDS4_9GAMM|nr:MULTISPECIES: hypothetical protein [Pantoea]KHJ69235.1 hypothetical protein QU24_04740 [Pantoea rodasii]
MVYINYRRERIAAWGGYLRRRHHPAYRCRWDGFLPPARSLLLTSLVTGLTSFWMLAMPLPVI